MGNFIELMSELPPTALLMLYLSEEMGLEPVLPELYSVLGEETMVDFLRIFGGRKIHVPSVREVKEGYLAVQMYCRVKELMGKGKPVKEATKQVAVQFDTSRGDVLTRCRKVRGILRYLSGCVKDA